MKLLFLVKYFEPFDRGGSEWSTQNLAFLLSKKGHDVTIATPNYGRENKEAKKYGFEIARIPFPIKVKDPKSTIAPYWTNNLIWFFYSFIYVCKLSVKNNYDVIHIQNNEFIPAGVFAAIFRRKRSVITFRDYQALCPLGFCFWNHIAACNIGSFKNDIKFFLKNYTGNDLRSKLIVNVSAYRAFFISKLLKQIAKLASARVAVSKSVANVYIHNGIKDIIAVQNAVIVDEPPAKTKHDVIVYVGKLSPGKGVDVLIDSLSAVFTKLGKATLLIAGSGMLKNEIETYIKKNSLSSRIKLLGQVAHEESLKLIRSAKLVVVPSTWPEPLPRSVIEALLLGTPVVATKSGGIPEIISEKYGITVPIKDSKKLASAVINLYEKNESFMANIFKDSKLLKNRYSTEPVSKYEKIYKG